MQVDLPSPEQLDAMDMAMDMSASRLSSAYAQAQASEPEPDVGAGVAKKSPTQHRADRDLELALRISANMALGEDHPNEYAAQRRENGLDHEQDSSSTSDEDRDADAETRRRMQRLMAIPPLTSGSGFGARATIPPLLFGRTAPVDVSDAARVWSFLDAIAFVSIDDVVTMGEDDAVHYVLRVHQVETQQRLPSLRHTLPRCASAYAYAAPSPSLSAPWASASASSGLTTRHAHDFHDLTQQRVIARRFSSFEGLRSNVRHAAAKSSHPRNARHCPYCARLRDFLANDTNQPNWHVKRHVKEPKDRRVLLAAFITELVYCVREGRDECPLTRTRKPRSPTAGELVQIFLTPETGETFMNT